MKALVRPRSGIEIYSAIFGKPGNNCVIVINKMDHIVPRLDCCIWLEFRTCPAELKRIISQDSYKRLRHFSKDTGLYIPDYGARPEWWSPQGLGDSVTVMQKFGIDNPNRDKIFVFSEDSSHVYYCDMAD